MQLCIAKAYLYSISCDVLYIPTEAEQRQLVYLLQQVKIPSEFPTTQNLLKLFTNPHHMPHRWDVWRGIVRTLALLLKEGE